MTSVEATLRRLEIRNPRFEYRLLPFAPSMGLFITDRKQVTGITKVEVYCIKPLGENSSRPHLVVDPWSPWRAFFHMEWDNYWNVAISHPRRQKRPSP